METDQKKRTTPASPHPNKVTSLPFHLVHKEAGAAIAAIAAIEIKMNNEFVLFQQICTY